jgi:hypothetical protein
MVIETDDLPGAEERTTVVGGRVPGTSNHGIRGRHGREGGYVTTRYTKREWDGEELI